jgi:hypothetical protein
MALAVIEKEILQSLRDHQLERGGSGLRLESLENELDYNRHQIGTALTNLADSALVGFRRDQEGNMTYLISTLGRARLRMDEESEGA